MKTHKICLQQFTRFGLPVAEFLSLSSRAAVSTDTVTTFVDENNGIGASSLREGIRGLPRQSASLLKAISGLAMQTRVVLPLTREIYADILKEMPVPHCIYVRTLHLATAVVASCWIDQVSVLA